jgi:acyl-CoA thioesterase FadM
MKPLSTQHLRVRTYECDSLGHVNNAVYIQYLLQATCDAYGIVHPYALPGRVRQLKIEYHTPTQYGDDLDITAWVVSQTLEGISLLYAITQLLSASPIVTAQIDWGLDPENAQPQRLWRDQATVEQARVVPMRLRSFVVPGENGALPFRWRHQVRRYELDMRGQIGTAVYFNWLEEVTYRAAARVGWTLERMQAEDVIVLQQRHDAEFFDTSATPDEIEIVSRLVEVRRIRGTWSHEVFQVTPRRLIMRDYSTGVFLDRQGRIRSAPAAMMTALIEGEPAAGESDTQVDPFHVQ